MLRRVGALRNISNAWCSVARPFPARRGRCCGAVFIDDAPPVFYWPELREDEGVRKEMEELGLMILFDIDMS